MMIAKITCVECGQVFDDTQLTKLLDENNREVSDGFRLIPEHSVVEGYKKSGIVSQTTGKTIKEFCNGSLRPPKKLSVH